MDGQHHRLDGHEFEQALGDGEGQGSLACCSPWGHKELDTTWRLNNNINPSFTNGVNRKGIADHHALGIALWCPVQKP